MFIDSGTVDLSSISSTLLAVYICIQVHNLYRRVHGMFLLGLTLIISIEQSEIYLKHTRICFDTVCKYGMELGRREGRVCFFVENTYNLEKMYHLGDYLTFLIIFSFRIVIDISF
jgi:hypothetical protein